MEKPTYQTTKQLLLNAPIPVQTRTYKPISNKELIDLTLNSIYGAGFTVEKELYSAAKEGNVANGRFLLNLSDVEMQLQVMWQNSYDKSKALTFAIGAHVLVCQNGMMAFRTMNSFKKKHMGTIQEITPHNIAEYIKGAGEMFALLQADREKMKEIQLSKRTTAELLGRMYVEEGFLESTQLNIIKRELEHPSHDYNAPGSLWELYQFTTFAIGGIHPSRWMDDHIDAHNFFTNEAGIIVNKPSIVAVNADVVPENQMSIYDVIEEVASESLAKEYEEVNSLISGNFQTTNYPDLM